jgi:hypothetical protein
MAKEHRNLLERFNCEENERSSLKKYGPKGLKMGEIRIRLVFIIGFVSQPAAKHFHHIVP